MKRPECCDDNHLMFLDDLQESGQTNMYGAAMYLFDKFTTLTFNECEQILSYWMDSYSERHR